MLILLKNDSYCKDRRYDEIETRMVYYLTFTLTPVSRCLQPDWYFRLQTLPEDSQAQHTASLTQDLEETSDEDSHNVIFLFICLDRQAFHTHKNLFDDLGM